MNHRVVFLEFGTGLFEEEHAHEIERLGGIPILNSHASADSFIAWFETHEW